MDTQHFKDKLEEELAVVQKQLVDTEHVDIDPSATEPDEVADRFEDEEVDAEEKTTLQSRRTDIEDALHKLQSGTFGLCEQCGATIEEDRLEANPAARTCVAHA